MSKKLYVASLPFSVNSEELEKIFSPIGKIASAKIITDSTTGKGKGFGFVEMESDEDTLKAIEQLNGTVYSGRTLLVSKARSENKNSINHTKSDEIQNDDNI